MPDINLTPDVAIVGGGLTGAVLALALRAVQPAIEITLIEQFDPEQMIKPKAGNAYDVRALAFSEGSRLFLEKLGIWQSCFAQAATPMLQVEVSEKGRFGTNRLSADESGVEALGYVVESGALGRALWAELEVKAGVQLLAPAKVEAIQALEQGYEVSVIHQGQPQQLRPKLTVVAEGGRSTLLDTLGIHREVKAYPESAVVAVLGLSRPHNNIAYERFDSHGPLALLPLQGNKVGFVWALPSVEAERLIELEDDAFVAEAQKAFGYRAGRFVQVGKRTHYPLVTGSISEQVREGLLLLGNVAHVLHPVAGQGFNLTLRDIERLLNHLNLGSLATLGNIADLRAYEQESLRDQEQTAKLSDGLVKLFANDHPALRQGRQLGRLALSAIGPARAWFTRKAMGVSRSSELTT